MESSSLHSHPFQSTAASIFHLQDNGRGRRGKKTTQEILFGSAFRLDVCYHLKTQEKTMEFLLSKKKKRIPGLDRFTHEINLWQYHKEFIWMPPDDPHCCMNEVWVDCSFSFFSLDRQTRSQPSSASGHADRIAFLFWFQFGCSDKCSGPGSTWTLTESLGQNFSLPSAWRETWKHLQDECCLLQKKNKKIQQNNMKFTTMPRGQLPKYVWIYFTCLCRKKNIREKKPARGKIAERERPFQNQFRR